MKLIELIGYIKDEKALNYLVEKELPNSIIDMIEIYLINSVDLNSEVKLLDSEQTESLLSIDINGVHHENLLPLNLAIDMVHDYMALDAELTDSDIAQKLIDYSINDA